MLLQKLVEQTSNAVGVCKHQRNPYESNLISQLKLILPKISIKIKELFQLTVEDNHLCGEGGLFVDISGKRCVGRANTKKTIDCEETALIYWVCNEVVS